MGSEMCIRDSQSTTRACGLATIARQFDGVSGDMTSYNRKCKHCGRWINIRQMPHGQWVAYEGDQQHDCNKARIRKGKRPGKVETERPGSQDESFKPYYPTVPGSPPPAAPAPQRTHERQGRIAPTYAPTAKTAPAVQHESSCGMLLIVATIIALAAYVLSR